MLPVRTYLKITAGSYHRRYSQSPTAPSAEKAVPDIQLYKCICVCLGEGGVKLTMGAKLG